MDRPSNNHTPENHTVNHPRPVCGLNVTFDPHLYVEGDRLNVRLLDPTAPGSRFIDRIPDLLGRWLGLNEARRVVRTILHDSRDVGYFQKVFDAFDFKADYPPRALERIPKTGPLIVTSNHPLHGADAITVAHVVSQVRSDLKMMLTSEFDGMPGLTEHAIFVDIYNAPRGKSRAGSTREAIAWLKRGHALMMMPAGQGSFVEKPRHKHPVDAPWQNGVSLLVRKTHAPVLPIFVYGGPREYYLTVRRIYLMAVVFLMVKELMRQMGNTIHLEIGEPISAAEILAKGNAVEQAQFLWERTYELDGECRRHNSRHKTSKRVT